MDTVVLCLGILMTAQQVLSVSGLDAVVCDKYPSYTLSVDCGLDAIIDVHHTTAAYFYNTETCNWPTIIAEMPNKAVTISFSAPVLGCHGIRRCDIPSNAGVRWERGVKLNTLHMKYDCLKLNSPTSAVLPIYQDITNHELNIFSPNYPDPMPSTNYSFSCNITSDGNRNQDVVLTFVVEKLFFPTRKQCGEDFFVNENGQTVASFCSSALEPSIIWQYHAAVTVPELSFMYKKQTDKPGGLFWLRIIGTSNQLGSYVNLTLTCPDQDQIPGYTPPTTTSTTTTTVTPSTVSTTSTTAISSITTETETENGSSSVNQNQIGDDDSKGDTTLLAALLCVAGLILIIVVVIIFLVMRIRKRKKHETNPDPSVMYSIAEPTSENNGKLQASDVNANLYSEVREDRDLRGKGRPGNNHDKNRTQIEYEDVLNENSDEMYAVVDKKGKNIEKKNIAEMYAVVDKRRSHEFKDAEADETIVWENDDLYDAGPAVEGQEDLYAVVDENRS